MIRNVEFNEVPVGSIFEHYDSVFIKVKNAIPYVKHPEQPSNCISLRDGHRIVIAARCPVDILAYPNEIDTLDSEIFRIKKEEPRAKTWKTGNPTESGEYLVITIGSYGFTRLVVSGYNRTKGIWVDTLPSETVVAWMKAPKRYEDRIPFCNLDIGDRFVLNGDPFIKVPYNEGKVTSPNCNSIKIYNAINLRIKEFCNVAEKVLVKRMDTVENSK